MKIQRYHIQIEGRGRIFYETETPLKKGMIFNVPEYGTLRVTRMPPYQVCVHKSNYLELPLIHCKICQTS